ncbi:MAG: hypothetical protein Q8O25_17390, partial [Sulfurisoma sp.]|nr:hypothetical protein [Sulfurisoma sp.]
MFIPFWWRGRSRPRARLPAGGNGEKGHAVASKSSFGHVGIPTERAHAAKGMRAGSKQWPKDVPSAQTTDVALGGRSSWEGMAETKVSAEGGGGA